MADVVVIGGGVIGLAIARELGRRGLRVTLVERSRPGAEASSAAAGMLAPQSEADHRGAFFDLLCASRDLYPSFAESLLEETGIDIELDQTGTLYLAFTEEDEREIERRYAWQARAGLSVERLTADEARVLEANISPHVRLALRFPLDAQVENRRLVAALRSSIEARGSRLLTDTNATAISVVNGRVQGVETSRGFVSAGTVVVAAGAWSSLLVPSFTTISSGESSFGIEPVRGQMLCFAARPPLVRHVVYTPRGYLVPRRDNRLLAGSTVEHVGFDKHVTDAGVQYVMRNALEISSRVGRLELVDQWAGLRPRAADGWPVIDAADDARGLYYATGHYRNGILLAPLTGELIAEMIVDERRSPLFEAFTVERFRPRVCVGSNGE